MKQTVFSILMLLLPFCVFSQKAPFQFGTVSIDELEMTSCSFYPDAHSMVLGELGNIYFEFDGERGWQYILEVTIRKKVFSAAGKDAGNVAIRLYDPTSTNSREKLESVSGFTYNLTEGKVEKIKVKDSERHEARINDFWKEVTFAFPNVQEGSVIEYKYKVSSDFLLNLRTWHFQSDIPVALSQFTYEIPHQLIYQVNQVGQVFILDDKTEYKTKAFRFRWERIRPGELPERGESEFEGRCTIHTLTAKNVPPVEEEPYQANPPDLPCRLEFQLTTVAMDGRPTEAVADSYETFNKKLLDSEGFGGRLSQGKFAELLVSREGKTGQEVASELLEKLQSHFAWNGDHDFFSDKSGYTVFKEQTGSSSDINLALVAAFRAYDFQAYPVILSTRGHGTAHPVYPNFQDFNYVVARVFIEGKPYFADATSLTPLGMLPDRCLNGKGWQVAEKGEWVDLKSRDFSFNQIVSLDVSLADGQWTNRVQFLEKGYACYQTLKKYKDLGADGFSKEFSADMEEWALSQFHFEDPSKKGEIKYNLELKKEPEDAGITYLSPLPFGTFGDNPFIREKRSSGVDFPRGISHKVVYKLLVPEGFSVEFPPSEKILLFDNSAQFSYQSVYDPELRTLRIVSDFSMKETFYTPEQYSFLREFFQRMEEKNKAMVVLKKE